MKFQLLAATALLTAFTCAAALPSHDTVGHDADLETREEPGLVDFNFTDDFGPSLSHVFSTIENIPDDVLAAGDEALDDWLVAQGIREPGATLKRAVEPIVNEDDSHSTAVWERAVIEARVSWWKVTKCVASIVQMLATAAIPAGKLLRIKKLISDLGGTKSAVELMLKATSKAEKLKVGGQALVDLSAEFLGISVVKSNCF